MPTYTRLTYRRQQGEIRRMAFHSPPAGFAREVLAANMRALRAKRGWSQEYLAFETGLHRTFIGHCERGVRNISVDNIEKIARAFNVPVSELFLQHQHK